MLHYDVERCNDCNNAAVLYLITMIVAIFVDFDDMVQKQCHHVACRVLLNCEDACIQS